MSSQPQSSSIPLSVMDSKHAANYNGLLPQSIPPYSLSLEVKVPSVPVQKTFLMKAQEDLAECERLDDESLFSSSNRTRMLALFRETLTRAQAAEIDTHLYTVYVSIDRLIKGLWWEDDLKAVFASTLRELGNNQLHRQRGEIQDLVEKIARLEGAIEKQKKTLNKQEVTISSITSKLDAAAAKLDDAAVTAKISQETVNKLLARLSNPNASSAAPEVHTRHDPRLLGGGRGQP